ncbi:YuiA family protein [Peribacillus deserti]|nr:YuiA family protein [Peribacillus deserti]
MPARTCPKCDGDGYISVAGGTSTITCPRCKGNGDVHD